MEWIKVEDKLPEDGQEVLVWANSIEGEIYYLVEEPSCAKVYFKKVDFSPIVDCDYYQVYAEGITHWMPLPKEPK